MTELRRFAADRPKGKLRSGQLRKMGRYTDGKDWSASYSSAIEMCLSC